VLTVGRATVLDVSIPFRFEFRHALASRDRGASVVVRLDDASGRAVGFGECAPREYVTGESVDSVVAALRDDLLPRMIGVSFASFDDVLAAARRVAAGACDAGSPGPAARCALELALLDLAGKSFSRSAGEAAGGAEPRAVRYGAVIPAESVETVRTFCARIRDANIRDVKLKVGADASEDDRRVAEARAILGDDATIRVDANGAWKDADEALRRIDSLARHRVAIVEQPTPKDALEPLAAVTRKSPIPIHADESLVSLEDGRRLVDLGACHGFNVRVSKCGGIAASAALRDLALGAGLAWMLGCQVGESAILSAAGRQLATRSAGAGAPPTALEGSYGTWILEEDVGRASIAFGAGGAGAPLDGPGLGVEIDEARLVRFARWQITVDAPRPTRSVRDRSDISEVR